MVSNFHRISEWINMSFFIIIISQYLEKQYTDITNYRACPLAILSAGLVSEVQTDGKGYDI